jgi:hypothetical protein
MVAPGCRWPTHSINAGAFSLGRGFEISQGTIPAHGYWCAMAAVLYKCPSTMGIRAQGWIAEQVSRDQDTYLPLQCIACKQMHYVNPATGRVIGGGDYNKWAASVAASHLARKWPSLREGSATRTDESALAEATLSSITL